MIKALSYQSLYYNNQKQKCNSSASFTSNNNVFSSDSFLPAYSYITKFVPLSLPWVKDENLLTSVNYLNNLQFEQNDIERVQALGVVLPFLSGKDAVKFIKDSNIKIKFDQLSSPNIHAQYDFDDNCIKINQMYRNTKNTAEILAISEAILHEAGHAKDKDGESSLQEEIDCLAMNALAHRAFTKKFPTVFADSNSLIVKDGVCVYADMFFDDDATKTRLIQRLKQKYGKLPAGDFNHSPSLLALQAKGN